MRWPIALGLGLLAYLAFLIHSLPAQLVLGWIGADSGAMPVAVEGVRGSIWDGEAQSVSYQRTPLGQIRWQFQPSGLLRGKLVSEVDIEDGGQRLQGTLVAGWSDNYRLENADALLRASRLPALLQQHQVRIDGKLRAQQLDLAFDKGRLTAANGTLQWLDGTLQSPLNLVIGDLQADLSSDEASGDITGQIRDLKGSIAVQAEIRLKPDGNFRFEGKLKPGDKADPGLTGALRAIGRQQPDGSILLNYAGRL